MIKAINIVPLLLQLMTKQSENINDEDMNSAKAAANCILFIAGAVGDHIIEMVLKVVNKNINNNNWRYRDAAVLAFGSILDGPDPNKLAEVFKLAFETVLRLMFDQHPIVRNSAAWTLGRVCDVLPQVFTNDTLPTLMKALIKGLDDEYANTANHMCWGIHNLANAIDTNETQDNALTPFFAELLMALMKTTNRNDIQEGNLLLSSWEAINALVHTSNHTTYQYIEQLFPELCNRLATLLQKPVYNAEQKTLLIEQMGLISSTIQVLINKLTLDKIISVEDNLFQLFLNILQYSSSNGQTNANDQQDSDSTLSEETIFALEALVTKLGKRFSKYISSLAPMLYIGLNNYEAHHACSASIGLLGAIARSLDTDFWLAFEQEKGCDALMKILLSHAQNQADVSIKPHIMSCIGDIAFAINIHFVKRYANYAMSALTQASESELDVEDEDDENIAMINLLRENIIDAFTMIVQALKKSNTTELLIKYLNAIHQFYKILNCNYKSLQLYSSTIGLIGDIASTYQLISDLSRKKL